MRTTILTAVGLMAFSHFGFAGDVDADAMARAGALYQKNCMGCHQPPDLRFETDRAWIGQILETA